MESAVARETADAQPRTERGGRATRRRKDRAATTSRRLSAHAQQLIHLVAELPPGELTGAEMGVCRGATSLALLENLENLKLTMVDSWATYAVGHSYRRSGDSCAFQSQAEQELRRHEAISRTEFASQRRRVLKADSASAADQLLDSELDFAFIDAEHTYEAVHRDLRLWWPKVRSGGILCGHDYNARRERLGKWGVKRAVDEFAQELGLTVTSGRGSVWWIYKSAALLADVRRREARRSRGSESHGVVYLLTGPAHAARLVTSLWSLRQYYDGPVTVFTSHPVSHEIGRLCTQDGRLQVEHRTIRPLDRRNGSYLLKLAIPRQSPYERTVFLDADTLVVGNISDLFSSLDDHDLALTQFADWNSTTSVVRQRIESWHRVRQNYFDDASWKQLLGAALKAHPAINVGVFGFRRGVPALELWRQLGWIGRKTFICDEIAMQIMLPQLDSRILDCRFNCSPVFAKAQNDVRVWHFHGDRHMSAGRALWWPAYQDALAHNVARLTEWEATIDPALAHGDTPTAPQLSTLVGK